MIGNKNPNRTITEKILSDYRFPSVPPLKNNEKQLIVTIKASLLLRKRLANKLRMRIAILGMGKGVANDRVAHYVH